MLGRAYDPLFVLKDPNAPDFAVPELTLSADVTVDRLAQRRGLLSEVAGTFVEQAGRAAAGMDRFQQRAIDLLTSEAAQRAFRIAKGENVGAGAADDIFDFSVGEVECHT